MCWKGAKRRYRRVTENLWWLTPVSAVPHRASLTDCLLKQVTLGHTWIVTKKWALESRDLSSWGLSPFGALSPFRDVARPFPYTFSFSRPSIKNGWLKMGKEISRMKGNDSLKRITHQALVIWGCQLGNTVCRHSAVESAHPSWGGRSEPRKEGSLESRWNVCWHMESPWSYFLMPGHKCTEWKAIVLLGNEVLTSKLHWGLLNGRSYSFNKSQIKPKDVLLTPSQHSFYCNM